MRLIEIEGLDGSGKETQSKKLAEYLNEHSVPALRITFPDYDHPWSVLAKMYLDGEFGDKPQDVNAYTASSFYALDRYASFKKGWGEIYRGGTVIVADRYVGSNLIHQMGKLPEEQWDEFFQWHQDFEYGKLELPRPDQVLFLDVNPETTTALMEERYHGDEKKKDVHERDTGYMPICVKAAHYAARRCGWKVISCCEGGELESKEVIHQRVLAALGLA